MSTSIDDRPINDVRRHHYDIRHLSCAAAATLAMVFEGLSNSGFVVGLSPGLSYVFKMVLRIGPVFLSLAAPILMIKK